MQGEEKELSDLRNRKRPLSGRKKHWVPMRETQRANVGHIRSTDEASDQQQLHFAQSPSGVRSVSWKLKPIGFAWVEISKINDTFETCNWKQSYFWARTAQNRVRLSCWPSCGSALTAEHVLVFQHFVFSVLHCPLAEGNLLPTVCSVAEPGGLQGLLCAASPKTSPFAPSDQSTLQHKDSHWAHKSLLQTLMKRKLKSTSFQAAHRSRNSGPLSWPGMWLLKSCLKWHIPLSFTWSSLMRRSSSATWGDTLRLPPANPRLPLRAGFRLLFSRPDHLILSSLPK